MLIQDDLNIPVMEYLEQFLIFFSKNERKGFY